MIAVQLKSSLPVLLLLLAVGRGEDNSTSVNSDAYLNTTGLIQKYGYPVETHYVVSDGGYILALFRIPYGKNCSGNGEPVICHHGFTSDSDQFLLQEHESLPYILADSAACYDVWLVNGRGNRYSRNHTTLDPDKLEYWQFSWHQQGAYDVPAIIDYIFKITGKTSLSYIGHSMGTTIFYVMGSERPEYLEKIRIAILLAPVVYMGNVTSPLVRIFSPFAELLRLLVLPVLHDEIPASAPPTEESVSEDANDEGAMVVQLVSGIVLGCSNPKEVNESRYAVQHSRGNSGASTHQAVHFAQSVRKNEFRQYAYLPIKNWFTYGSSSPPDYNLKNISCKVVNFYSNGDCLVAQKDVLRLSLITPFNVQFYYIAEDGFAHSDYMIGKNAPKLVYEPMMRVMAGEDIGASKDVFTTSGSSVRKLEFARRHQLEGKKKTKLQKAKKSAAKHASSARRRQGRHRRQ